MKLIKTGSSTKTMRAQDILAANGVRARIRKLEDESDGCTRALELEDTQAATALRLLAASGITAHIITGARG